MREGPCLPQAVCQTGAGISCRVRNSPCLTCAKYCVPTPEKMKMMALQERVQNRAAPRARHARSPWGRLALREAELSRV